MSQALELRIAELERRIGERERTLYEIKRRITNLEQGLPPDYRENRPESKRGGLAKMPQMGKDILRVRKTNPGKATRRWKKILSQG